MDISLKKHFAHDTIVYSCFLLFSLTIQTISVSDIFLYWQKNIGIDISLSFFLKSWTYTLFIVFSSLSFCFSLKFSSSFSFCQNFLNNHPFCFCENPCLFISQEKNWFLLLYCMHANILTIYILNLIIHLNVFAAIVVRTINLAFFYYYYSCYIIN